MSYGGVLGECSQLGEGPDHYMVPSNWIGYTPGSVVAGTGNAICGTPSTIASIFNTVLGVPSFWMVAVQEPGGWTCSGVRYASTEPTGSKMRARAATMLEVVKMTPKNEAEELGREIVAALLNVNAFAARYPLTKSRVINMFKDVHDGVGTYAPADPMLAKNPWPRSWVLRYLKSLHTPMTW
jgi:hypothetical protein